MLGILGGTFDPIHYGHLNAAWQSLQNLPLTQLCFMPCHHPPHRAYPQASATHRLNMLKLATHTIAGFEIDTRELKHEALSYTVHSLSAIRKTLGDQPICLLLGSDAFNYLSSWHQAERLIELAHLVIIDRPSTRLKPDPFIEQLLKQEIQDQQLLQQHAAGLIYFANNTLLDISATQIRENLAHGISPRFLLPDTVLDYITTHQLYTHYPRK